MDITELKKLIIDEAEAQRERLTKLSLKIHAHPETGFNEVQASGWLTEYLAEMGFTIEVGICGFTTAFRASYGRGKPSIALLAEYDALPDLGHACGHNIIAVSAVGAAIAARTVIDRLGGSIMVIGTPAEELYGGKVVMAEQGAFSDIDAALMVHPGGRDTAVTYALACQNVDFEFFGRPSHAAASPEAGINALEAMILAFNAINSLRQHIRDKSRVHGIITDGGQVANIVPAHSAGTFIVRAEDNNYLDELKEKVLKCFEGAAQATGARLEYRWADIRYAAMRNNLALAGLFKQNMESLGRQFHLDDPDATFGSTDMGNVSQVVPSIHARVAIVPPEIPIHTPQFAEAAASEAGSRGLLDSAKALAMTAADLIASPELLSEVRAEFGKH